MLSAAETDHTRLAFDVLNSSGGLVYTGSILHPIAGRLEVVDDSAKGEPLFHATPNSDDAVFAINLPNVPELCSVRFYEADAGLDLASEQGRSARRFVKEITIKP